MQNDMSEKELTTIRWVEHVMAPLLVLSIATLATCSYNMQTAVAQLETQQNGDATLHVETKKSLKDLSTKQSAIVESQHELEVTVKRIETHQEHFKDEIQDLKKQNDEIIRLIRSQ